MRGRYPGCVVSALGTVWAVDTYRIYDRSDENGIVGTMAPGLFAQEGRCWRMVYANPAGHPTHCMQPVAWVGRWKFLKGCTKVRMCDRHADELKGASRMARCRSGSKRLAPNVE